jgi:hypothetical protein
MEQSNEIKCPKCGSNQVTANKKGFSGRKAVAGAVLTGGIGLLAGTIGSNKIKITCLSCGHQFKPGGDLVSITRKKEAESEAMKSPAFWVIAIGLILLLFWFMKGCSGDSENKNKTTSDYSATLTDNTSEHFVKNILNCSPKEVSKVLGEPEDKIKVTKDCDYLPSCNSATYQNGKYEVLYYKNKLKWITINQKGLFDDNAMQYIGFQKCEPTFSNPPYGIWWRNSETKGTATGPLLQIKGLREIAAFPNYILITVETNYDKKF